MNSSQKVVLDLVRKAIDPSIEIDVPIEVNWGEVRKYAKEQGVLGICFDSIEDSKKKRRIETKIFRFSEIIRKSIFFK